MTNNVLQFPEAKTMSRDFYRQRSTAELRSSKPGQTNKLYLAPRYQRVLVLLSQGATPQEVGRELNLKPITTWGYMEEIFLRRTDIRQRLALYVLELLKEQQDDAC